MTFCGGCCSTTKYDVRDDKLGGDTVGASVPPSMNVCTRLCSELTMPPFQIQEIDNKIVNIPASFCPSPLWLTGSIKFLLLVLSVTTLSFGILDWSPTYFDYFFGFDHCTLVITVLYFILSLYNTAFPPIFTSAGDPTLCIKCTWALFAVAAPAQLLSTIIFWGIEFINGDERTRTIVSYMVHGGLFVLLMMEGLILNRIPIRACHLVYPFRLVTLYIIWTVLYEYFEIGYMIEPNADEGSTNLYPYFSWKDDPGMAAAICATTLLVILPVLFTMIWLISLSSCCCVCKGLNRRYMEIGEVRERLVVEQQFWPWVRRDDL